LITDVVDRQHTNTRAIVDRRELIEAPTRAGDPLEELDFHL
jgi:hypothetical protein